MAEAPIIIGPLALRAFALALGVALAGAVALASYYLSRWATPGAVFDAFLGGLIGGALGGRLAHVVFAWDYFSLHPEAIPRLSEGGLEWHGALAGALIGLAIVSRWRRLPWGPLLNVLAPILPLIALGAWSFRRPLEYLLAFPTVAYEHAGALRRVGLTEPLRLVKRQEPGVR